MKNENEIAMTSEEVLEGNKLIAEFMGEEVLPIKEHDLYPLIKGYDGLEQTKYHTSWNWLMPVVERIEGISIAGFERYYDHAEFEGRGNFNLIRDCDGVCIYANLLYYQSDRPIDGIGRHEGSGIAPMYKAAVEFIKWYNNSNKTA